jgi:hypothetical protein
MPMSERDPTPSIDDHAERTRKLIAELEEETRQISRRNKAEYDEMVSDIHDKRHGDLYKGNTE